MIQHRPRHFVRALLMALVALPASSLAHEEEFGAAINERDLISQSAFVQIFGDPVYFPLEPARDGAWGVPFDFPEVSVNAAVLPTGKVLTWGLRLFPQTALFDPSDKSIEVVPTPEKWNPTCSGHAFLSDGRLLIGGGRDKVADLGYRSTFIFDPFDEEWQTQVGDFRRGRFYPSCILLPDERVLTFSGYWSTSGHGIRNDDVELFDPRGQGNWEKISQRNLPFYPQLHVMASGEVLIAGPHEQAELYDIDTDTYTVVSQHKSWPRYFAPSVLLPPNNLRVMVIGGNDESQTGGGYPQSSTEIIDFAKPNPQWEYAASMRFPRMDHNAVILPDGTIFVVGGVMTEVGVILEGQPNYIPELYDPAENTWRDLAPHREPRVQHSTALLLPDARILVMGRPEQASAEIYSPPYLFRGPRPKIVSATKDVVYRGKITIEFESETRRNRICMIRLSSVTHSVNFGQRYIDLGSVELDEGQRVIKVDAPKMAAKAPPGYYMLFVVDQEGVPSRAEMLRLYER